MKKIYILAAIALVAGVSCTKQVPADNNSPDVPILFEPVSQRATTKAEVFGEQNSTYSAFTTANTYEKFKAYAAFSDDALSSPDITANITAEFFTASGVQCSPYLDGSTLKYWKADGSYYWPKTGYLTFHTFSPSAPGTGTLSHNWDGGFTLADFTVATNAAQQVDLLYSDFEFNKRRNKDANDFTNAGGNPYDDDDNQTGAAPDGTTTTSPFAYNGVNIKFNHALASIAFQAKVQDDNYAAKGHTFKIKTIEILYPYQTGTFHENRSKADLSNAYVAIPTADSGYENIGYTWATGNSPYWAVKTTSELASANSYVAYNNADYSSALTTAPTQFYDVATYSNDILALPQSLDHGTNKVSVKVTYQYIFNDGTHPAFTKELNTTVSLASATGKDGVENPTTTRAIDKWLINHKYIYTLNFTLEEIIFDPAVSDFVTVTVDAIDLPNIDA